MFNNRLIKELFILIIVISISSHAQGKRGTCIGSAGNGISNKKR